MAVLPPGLTAAGLRLVLQQGRAGADPISWADVLRHDVIPVASAYLVVLVMLLAYARRPGVPDGRRRTPLLRLRRAEPAGPGREPSWRDLALYVIDTAIGGYALFLGIVVTYYFALGGESADFLIEAVREGSALAFAIVVPGLLLITWVHERLGR